MKLNLKTSKKTQKPYTSKLQVASNCRRCGIIPGECQCSEDELDSGGPAV